MNITAEGKDLGIVIVSAKCHEKYGEDLVKDWDNHLTFCELLEKHNRKQFIQHFLMGLKTN